MTPKLQSRILACHDAKELGAMLPEIEFETDAGLIQWRVTPEGNAVTLTRFEQPLPGVQLHLFPRHSSMVVNATWIGELCGDVSIEASDRLCELVMQSILLRILPNVAPGSIDEMARAVVVRSGVLWMYRNSPHEILAIAEGEMVETSLLDQPVQVSAFDAEIYALLEARWNTRVDPLLITMMKSRGPRWIFANVARVMAIVGKNFETLLQHEIMPEDGLGGREFVELLVLLERQEGRQTPLPIIQIAAACVCHLWSTFESAKGLNGWLDLLTVLDEETLSDVSARLNRLSG